MDVVEDYPIRRFDAGRGSATGDRIVTEARIELDVNDGLLRLAMLCMPRELDALAVGFLAGEGVLRKAEDLAAVEVDLPARRVRVTGELDADALEGLARRWTWGTGCGGGGTGRDMDRPAYAAVGEGLVIRAGRLGELARQFQGLCQLWAETGGVHACALAGSQGIALYSEDVGRHNAFDKVIGRALLDGIDVTDKLVLTTGRLSAEIVSKAVACRVPLLASRSAVTTLSATLARRFGVTLVGFLRGRRLNVYTGFQRVLPDEGP